MEENTAYTERLTDNFANNIKEDIKRLNASSLRYILTSIPMEKFKKINQNQIIINNKVCEPKKIMVKRNSIVNLLSEREIPQRLDFANNKLCSPKLSASNSKAKLEHMTIECFDKRRMMFLRCNSTKSLRKYSDNTGGDKLSALHTPDIVNNKQRAASIQRALTKKKLMKRQSTNRVKFEDFSESQETFCNNIAEPDKSYNLKPMRRGSFNIKRAKCLKLRNTPSTLILDAVIKAKELQNDKSKMVRTKERLNIMFENASQANIRSYVNRIRERLEELKQVPEEKKEESERKFLQKFNSKQVNSKILLNDILRRRDEFTLANDEERMSTPKKFVMTNKHNLFSYKRRSLDFNL